LHADEPISRISNETDVSHGRQHSLLAMKSTATAEQRIHRVAR